MSNALHNREYSRSYHNNSNAWKDKENQRKHELDGGLCRQFFRLLPALRAQGVGEVAQGFGDWSSETVRLSQHGYKRPYAFQIHTIRQRLPGGKPWSPGPLFEVYLQQLITQFRVTHVKLLAYPHNPLVQAQPGLHTDRQQDRKSTRLNSSHLVISYAV